MTRMMSQENARQSVTQDLDALREDALSLAQAGADVTREVARSVAEKTRDAHAHLREGVTSRPMTSLLVAAGLGALCGFFLLRR